MTEPAKHGPELEDDCAACQQVRDESPDQTVLAMDKAYADSLVVIAAAMAMFGGEGPSGWGEAVQARGLLMHLDMTAALIRSGPEYIDNGRSWLAAVHRMVWLHRKIMCLPT